MLLAGALGVAAAGLAIAGLNGAIFAVERQVRRFDDASPARRSANEYTWWSRGELSTHEGIALIVAASLVGIGAILAFVAFGVARRGIITASRSVLALGGGVLTGATLLIGLQVQDWARSATEALDGSGLEWSFRADYGLWLPIAAVGAGLVATLLAHLARSGPPPIPQDTEPPTPPTGFPVPYGPGPATGQQPAVQVTPLPAESAPENQPAAGSDSDEQANRPVIDQTPPPVNPAAGQAPSDSDGTSGTDGSRSGEPG